MSTVGLFRACDEVMAGILVARWNDLMLCVWERLRESRKAVVGRARVRDDRANIVQGFMVLWEEI